MELAVSRLCFYEEKETLSGVRKIAGKLREDMARVFGAAPDCADTLTGAAPCALLYGTIGHSPILDRLHGERAVNLNALEGKREVFLFEPVSKPLPGIETALVIAGSDKLGTIYGLFHLSELMGVSPLVDWSDVRPAPKTELLLDKSHSLLSKEPSVWYRGLFINDEWPAFGNWANKRFGGFNAAMYDHVFELILRHKGNFMWPAMWTSSFSCDGPGLAAAELADEYGIVIGTSHHEPCIRHGEEYSHVRGPGSPYGDAWDFRANREGITRFWRDGLRRNKGLGNIVTLGMRGERDSTILGREATLQDNIELLRDVITVQNKLIQEELDPVLKNTPRCLVMFTEVERFYHGEEGTPGLAGDPCLDDVTLMLCDDNFGNIKSMPRGAMKEHKGGFGLYYHFDFHGGPTSYEWVNSTYLPKMWEQLSMAYELGVCKIWVCNVGDLCLQEYPLAYYFEMAYDMERYGAGAPNRCGEFTEMWLQTQFGGGFSQSDIALMQTVLDEYTGLNHNRKPELADAGVYHPVHFGEAEDVLERCAFIEEAVERLRAKCPETLDAAFFELIYFPAAASANVQKMWVLAGRNAFFAAQNRVVANTLAEEIAACIRRDRALTEELHSIGGGKWYGMGLSEHIGFRNWLEEGNRYPLMTRIEPANKPRLIVAHSGHEAYTEGGAWSGKTLVFRDFLRPDIDELCFDIACGSRMAVPYKIHCDCPWLHFSSLSGCVETSDRVTVRIMRNLLTGPATAEAVVEAENTRAVLRFEGDNTPLAYPPMTFVEQDGYICMEAEHCYAASEGSFLRLSPYGRTLSAMKPVRQTEEFSDGEKPWVAYRFAAATEGMYTLCLYLSPSNPLFFDASIDIELSVNEGEARRENTTGEHFRAHNFSCEPWVRGVTENVRIHRTQVALREGLNTLRIYAVSPGMALERLVLHPESETLPASYLGPNESYFVPAYQV